MKIATQNLFLVVFLSGLPAACASQTSPEQIKGTRNYNATFQCDGGQRAVVRFTPFNAALESDGVSVAMAQQPVAEGLLYAGQGQKLRAIGNLVIWTDDKGAVHRCREATATGPGDGAKTR